MRKKTKKIKIAKTKSGSIVTAALRSIKPPKAATSNIRLLFTSARCLIWNATVKRKKGKFIWVFTIANEGACRQFLPVKISSRQSYKDAWRASILKEDLPHMDFTSSYAILMGKTDYAQSFRIKNASDETRWLSEDVHVKKTGKDKWRLLGVCMDITDSKRAEESLRDSEQRYKKLIDLSPDAITVHSDGKIVFVNPAGVKLVGAGSYRDLVGKPVLSIVHPDSKKAVQERMLQMTAHGRAVPVLEEKFMKLDGTPIYVEAVAMPMVYKGTPSIMAVIRDVTEKKVAQEKLNVTHQRLLDIIEFLPDPVFVVDKERTVIAWNLALEILTGVPKEKILGKKDTAVSKAFYNYEKPMLMNLVFKDPGCTLSALEEHYDYIDKKNNTYFAEVFIPSLQDGKGVYIWVKAAPLYDPEGNLTGVIESLRDITDRKQFEQKIKYLSFNDKLTEMYNRAFCEEEMKRLDTVRELPLSLIIGDVNNLKVTNDIFGHHEGDRLLVEVGKILKDSCRKGDIVARWGGDEFLMLLPRTDSRVAESIVERITEKCSQVSELSLKPSIALGTATKMKPNDDILSVLKDAEDKMYCNKLFIGQSTHKDFIASVEKALWERGKENRRHVEEVRRYMVDMGKALKMSAEQLEDLSLLGLLHDIGKISIPEAILLKSGPLTPDEWNIMRKHSEIGFRIAQTYHIMKDVSDSILFHHEKWNGTGYPAGLKGDQIPLNARLLSIVDAFDTMINMQPYKPALKRDMAVNELIKNSGTHFDPELVKVFISVLTKKTDPK